MKKLLMLGLLLTVAAQMKGSASSTVRDVLIKDEKKSEIAQEIVQNFNRFMKAFSKTGLNKAQLTKSDGVVSEEAHTFIASLQQLLQYLTAVVLKEDLNSMLQYDVHANPVNYSVREKKRFE